MAVRESGPIEKILERIVTKPWRATLTVGTSILVLMYLINQLATWWPEIGYFQFIVPFIPPFFITRTAKRMNQRRAEYDFIKDAEPYIFVAFPAALNVPSILKAKADMISNSAPRYFNCTIEKLLEGEALPRQFFVNPEDLETIAMTLIESYQTNDCHGVLRNFPLTLMPEGTETISRCLLNSVLKKKGRVLKWQGTLIKYE